VLIKPDWRKKRPFFSGLGTESGASPTNVGLYCFPLKKSFNQLKFYRLKNGEGHFYSAKLTLKFIPYSTFVYKIDRRGENLSLKNTWHKKCCLNDC